MRGNGNAREVAPPKARANVLFVGVACSEEAIREIARDAERVNSALENIGARRLHTILERLLEEISFAGPENEGRTIRIEVEDVRTALTDLVKNEDLSRYVL